MEKMHDQTNFIQSKPQIVSKGVIDPSVTKNTTVPTLLLFIFPYGLYVMWKKTKWPIFVKIFVTLYPIIFFVSIYLFHDYTPSAYTDKGISFTVPSGMIIKPDSNENNLLYVFNTDSEGWNYNYIVEIHPNFSVQDINLYYYSLTHDLKTKDQSPSTQNTVINGLNSLKVTTNQPDSDNIDTYIITRAGDYGIAIMGNSNDKEFENFYSSLKYNIFDNLQFRYGIIFFITLLTPFFIIYFYTRRQFKDEELLSQIAQKIYPGANLYNVLYASNWYYNTYFKVNISWGLSFLGEQDGILSVSKSKVAFLYQLSNGQCNELCFDNKTSKLIWVGRNILKGGYLDWLVIEKNNVKSYFLSYSSSPEKNTKALYEDMKNYLND